MGTKSRFNCTLQAFHQGVTGSCILVCVRYPDGSDERFLVDCGMYQGKDTFEENFSFKFNPENIRFLLVTHNHTDHTGRIPKLVKDGFKGPIYTSSTNCSLMPNALLDSVKILKGIAKTRGTKALYNDDDVQGALYALSPVNWGESFRVSENIKATFFKNGHLLGASTILVEISFPGFENINILFSGDYSPNNIFFDVPELPKRVRDLPLTVICESTYGKMDTTDVKYTFASNVIEALKKGKIIMCPVFSQGRAQEILYHLKMMQDMNAIDINIPIYLDGNLAIKYTRKYMNCYDISDNMKDFLPKNFSYVIDTEREDLIKDTSSKIILSSSGMGCYGPSQIYIPEFIQRENALIHFTGYCAEETLGRVLQETPKGNPVIIGGRVLKKVADVCYTSEFSAHAKADELINFLNQFKQLKMVLVNHGEPDVKEAFAERVLKEINTKNIGILGASYAFRIDRYGYVKSLPV